MRTRITAFLITDELLGTSLSPLRDGSEYDLFANRDGKILDQLTGKILTLVTALVSLRLRASLDGTVGAVDKWPLRQTTFTVDVFRRELITPGQRTLINIDKPFLELYVIVPGRIEDGTDSTVQAARCNKVRIDFHLFPPLPDAALFPFM
jgi:hypothetical protein